MTKKMLNMLGTEFCVEPNSGVEKVCAQPTTNTPLLR